MEVSLQGGQDQAPLEVQDPGQGLFGIRELGQGLFQALNRESWLKRGCGWRRREGGSF